LRNQFQKRKKEKQNQRDKSFSLFLSLSKDIVSHVLAEAGMSSISQALILLANFYAIIDYESQLSPRTIALATAPAGRKASPERRKQRAEQRSWRCVKRGARLLVLTTIAKPMNRFAACGDPRAEKR
jgi:hypothetical protein